MSDTPKLRLCVVGQRSGNPDDWPYWSARTLVIAETKERAMQLTDSDPSVAVSEIVLAREMVLIEDRPDEAR
jgi:hypothetical protein